MAGLEGVVRPIIFPDIRPRPRAALPPQEDPTKGFAVISGNPAGSTSSSLSWSLTTSQSRPVEVSRRVDTARIYQEEENGDINRDNYVDVEVANKITMEEPGGGADNKLLRKNYWYTRITETDNVAIIRKDDIVMSVPNI